jgi:hypothetical protein
MKRYQEILTIHNRQRSQRGNTRAKAFLHLVGHVSNLEPLWRLLLVGLYIYEFTQLRVPRGVYIHVSS